MKNRIENLRHLDGDRSLQPGSFLIAHPILKDSGFAKTVIFLLQHSEKGVFGAVLNRPADRKSLTSWNKMTGIDFAQRMVVNGGPVGGPVVALHNQKQLAEVEISGGICLSVDADAFRALAEQTDSEYRIVLGLAAWSTDQLWDEIESGYWYQIQVDPMHVFDEPDMMWQNFMREFGRQTIAGMVGSKFVPQNPNLN